MNIVHVWWVGYDERNGAVRDVRVPAVAGCDVCATRICGEVIPAGHDCLLNRRGQAVLVLDSSATFDEIRWV